MKRARESTQSGFTLIELMLVIIAVAALGAIVIPQMAGTRSRFELDADARALLAMARRARTVAVSEGRGCRLAIDPEERTYRLVRDLDPLADPEDASSDYSSFSADGERAGEAPRFRESGKLGASTVVTLVDLDTTDGSASPAGSEPSGAAGGIGTTDAFEIVFNPDGTAQTAEVVLEEEDGNGSWTLTVRGPTGQAKVQLTVELEIERGTR